MKMFNLIGIGERAGSGVPDIFAVWKQEDWKEPEVEEQYGPDRTILTLPLVKKKAKKQAKKASEKNKRNKTSEIKQAKKTIENREKIIDFLRKNGLAKTSEISKTLGLSETRTRSILKEMADAGEIFTNGSTKKKSYYL